MKVDIRVPVGLPVRETADFIAGCEAAGFTGVGVHDHQHSGRDVFLTLALAAERTSRLTLYPGTLRPRTRLLGIRWYWPRWPTRWRRLHPSGYA